MTQAKRGPRAGSTADAGEFDRVLGSIHHPRPRCKLFGCNLVNNLPRGCPLADASPFGVVHAQQDRGYQLLAPGPEQDVTGGLAALSRAEVCGGCVGDLLADPWVRRLRALALAALPQRRPAPEAPAKPGPQIKTKRVSRRKGVA